MNNNQLTPPKLAKLLLQLTLPKHVKNEISGDLEEEFHQQIKKDNGDIMANRWFWQQSIATCLRYLFTKQRLLSTLIILIAFSILTTLYIAIISLSYANTEFFNDAFWYNGNIHLLFFESKFWHFTSNDVFQRVIFQPLIDSYSAIFSVLALFILIKLNKKYQFKVSVLSLLALGLMLSPYLYGFIMFQLVELTNQEVGPLIAFMWLPIMYMILPITYLIVKKINATSSTNLINNN